MTIAERWRELWARIEGACARAGRNPAEVRVVAISKGVPAQRVVEAYRAGIGTFGENYVQEALPKIEAAARTIGEGNAKWHFVGALQSNKARKAGPFSLIHSLDRWSLAEALEKHRKAGGRAPPLLAEINAAGWASKSGVGPDALRPLLERVSAETGLAVSGLMSFPPYSENREESRRHFARTRELAEEVRGWNLPRIEMKELSMGISSDFEAALQEGATLLRIGTAIFGPRG